MFLIPSSLRCCVVKQVKAYLFSGNKNGHLLSLETIVWVESFSWSLSFGFAGGKLLGGELQFCLGGLSQSLHPL